MKSIEYISRHFGVSRSAVERHIFDGSVEILKAKKEHLHVRGVASGKITAKGVKQLSLEGVLIKQWDSMIEAARTLGINQGNISNCTTGRAKSAGGFKWVRE